MTGQHPWNAAPTQPRGTQSSDEIYASVGRALSRWEALEVGLGGLFGALVGATDCEGAPRAYGTVSNAVGRQQMLSVALKYFPRRETTDFAELSDLLKRVEQFAPRRNDIAHGVVVNYSLDGRSLGHYLTPPSYNTRKNTQAASGLAGLGDYAYTAEQIDAYSEHFAQMLIEVAKFVVAAFAAWREIRAD